MNAIRLDGGASLRGNDEAQRRHPGCRRCSSLRGSVRKRMNDTIGWVATERDQAAVCVKQGDLRDGLRAVFMLSESRRAASVGAGVRAPIVATKRL